LHYNNEGKDTRKTSFKILEENKNVLKEVILIKNDKNNEKRM